MAIDHSQVTAMALKLERLPLEMRAKLRTVVKQGADAIAAQAKVNANFSTRIPGAISTQSSSALSVTKVSATVRVSAAKAPHARVLEEGNVGSSSTTTFRHPVYGRDWWTPQPMHPFLAPAVAGKEREIVTAIMAAIETTQKGL